MGYNETAKEWELQPEEIKLLKEFFESPTYRLLLEMEEVIKQGARRTVEYSDDIHEVNRAQGILRGFRLRDGSLKQIFDAAQKEEQENEPTGSQS